VKRETTAMAMVQHPPGAAVMRRVPLALTHPLPLSAPPLGPGQA